MCDMPFPLAATDTHNVSSPTKYLIRIFTFFVGQYKRVVLSKTVIPHFDSTFGYCPCPPNA